VVSLKKEKAASLISEMTPGQAADILSVLHWRESKKILKLFEDKEKVRQIESILEKREEKILDYVIGDYLRFPPDITAKEALEKYQEAARGKDVVMYLYVINSGGVLLGVIDIKELLQSEDEEKLSDIMTTHIISLKANSTLREAYQMFARYGFRALPITDKSNRVLGVIPYRDVMNLKHLFL